MTPIHEGRRPSGLDNPQILSDRCASVAASLREYLVGDDESPEAADYCAQAGALLWDAAVDVVRDLRHEPERLLVGASLAARLDTVTHAIVELLVGEGEVPPEGIEFGKFAQAIVLTEILRTVYLGTHERDGSRYLDPGACDVHLGLLELPDGSTRFGPYLDMTEAEAREARRGWLVRSIAASAAANAAACADAQAKALRELLGALADPAQGDRAAASIAAHTALSADQAAWVVDLAQVDDVTEETTAALEELYRATEPDNRHWTTSEGAQEIREILLAEARRSARIVLRQAAHRLAPDERALLERLERIEARVGTVGMICDAQAICSEVLRAEHGGSHG